MNTNGALTDNNLDVSNLNEEQLKQVMDIFEAANEEELMASMKEGGEVGEALGGSAAGGGLNIPPTVTVTSVDENGIVEYEVITYHDADNKPSDSTTDGSSDGIVGETECIALGVMVLNKLDNTTVAGSSNSPGNSPPRFSPAGPPSMKRKLQEMTTPPTNPITTMLTNLLTGPPTKSPTNPTKEEETGEVGMY